MEETAGALMNSAVVNALIIRTAGTNCDQETIHALTLAGAKCHLTHINQLITGRIRLHPYQILVIPGGFSYGDDISAGKVLANELRLRLKGQLQKFVEAKKLVIGICNGFQVLVKAGLLPGFQSVEDEQTVTLSLNDSARFQCQWVGIKCEKSVASWLDSMPNTIDLPIAHGEGRYYADAPLEAATDVAYAYPHDGPVYGKARTPAGHALLQRLRLEKV